MRACVASVALVASAALGCSGSTSTRSSGAGGAGGSGFPTLDAATSAGGAFLPIPGADAARSGTGVPVPTDFVPTDIGGYRLGDPITAQTPDQVAGNADGGTGCDVLVGVVRDFKGINEPGGHPDFEAFSGRDVTRGLVASVLGGDEKPVYASECEAMPVKAACPYGQQTTSKSNFDAWYRFTANVNEPYLVYLLFAQNGGVATFSSNAFFPLDSAGWGNSPHKSHHNFGFTTELHTAFAYRGGEKFTFTGDDDVWVFVNGKLAIDLGGLHPSKSATLTLDDSATMLGIAPGNTYSLDLFHAERHSANSDFRVDTTLAFTNCGRVEPEIR